jgi:diguanylate cyclase (GGDEF) domain
MVEAKILIADDSKMNQQILSEILGGRYEYLYADDGMQALELLLLDINMPRLDGFGVLEVMKQRNWLQEIPVIITSSEDDESFIQKAYELGVTDHIRRPFNLTVTQRRVSNALTLYARQKHLVHLAEEQVYEHEKTNSAIINILSHIVESRNFESGTHILHVRAITDILLRQLVAATNRCPLSQARIPTRSDSSGPKAAGIDRSRRFLRNGAQNRKEASWLTTNFSLACSPQRRR